MRNFLLAPLFVPLAASAQSAETLFNLVTLNAQAARGMPNDLLTATLAAEAESADTAQLSGGGAVPIPMYMMSTAAPMEARQRPAVEPGTTRILITVSGTIQLQ